MELPPGWGLSLHHSGSWYDGDPYDLTPTGDVLTPGYGASIVPVGSSQPTYQDCRGRTDYSGPIPWKPQLPPGSYVCIKITENRVGYARVDYKPNQDNEITRVRISGVIWQPKE